MHKLENNIYTETFRLHSFEVGMNTRILPHCYFNIFLHCAWAHASTSKYSFEELQKEGQFWVLSRFKALLFDLPVWGEEITVNTWGKGTDRLFALRDYTVLREDGTQTAVASSAWLVVDKKTMRPQRINELERKFNSRTDLHGIKEKLDKIPQAQVTPTGETYKIRYSDIDVNKHFTSAKYLQLMFDSINNELLINKQLKSFELNFTAEAHLNETISIFHGKHENSLICSLLRIDDNTEICRGMFEFV